MMGAKNVDIVFVIDASDSMAPCIESVKANLGLMLDELKKVNYHVRLDMVAQNVPGEHVYSTESIFYRSGELINALYHDSGKNFFTEDIEDFSNALRKIQVEGDEDMLFALDCALDFPFEKASTTQRVVVLLSDEPFETNYLHKRHGDNFYQERVDEVIEKIHARHISLFMVMPSSELADRLSEADRSDYAALQHGRDGLKTFDFSRFFSQLGKTISVTTAQLSHEKPFKKALFGQDKMGVAHNITRIGDSVE